MKSWTHILISDWRTSPASGWIKKCSRISTTLGDLQTHACDIILIMINVNELVKSFFGDFLLFLGLDFLDFDLFLLLFKFLLLLLLTKLLLMLSEFRLRVEVKFFFLQFVHDFVHEIFVLFRFLFIIIDSGQSSFDLFFEFFSKSVGRLHKFIFTLTRK